MRRDPYPHLVAIHSSWILHLYVKGKATKLPEEKAEYFYDLAIRKDFFNKTKIKL